MQAERVLTDAQYHVQFSFDTLYTTHMHRLCSDNYLQLRDVLACIRPRLAFHPAPARGAPPRRR